MITALFSVSNGTIATAHTTDIDKDTTSLPGGQRNAQININEVCTILFHLHRTNLVLTDDDDDDAMIMKDIYHAINIYVVFTITILSF